MNLYDVHSHILPQIDDGAENVDVSVNIINTLYNQGVRHICLTPHYYTHQESMESFLSRRESSFNLLKPNLPSDIEFCLGAEVYVTDIIMNNKSLKPVCYGNSDYILLEFPYSTTFTGSSYEFLFRIINQYGVMPILAHIERYESLIKNPKLLQKLSSEGVLFQTNAVSYKNKAIFRKFKKLLNKNLIHFIGSDAHNMIRNSPTTYCETFELINKKVGDFSVDKINQNAKRLFEIAK